MADVVLTIETLAGLLQRQRVLPVIELDSVDQGIGVVGALIDGGITLVEITLRSEASFAALEAAIHRFPEAIIGAGTLRTPAQIGAVRDAGARFGVSPGLTASLANAARDAEFPLIPGAATPSEVMAAAEAGFSFVKFFPAENLGGVSTLKAWAGPFPEMRFCPTGGVKPETAAAYLSLPNVVCVGGSWLAPRAAMALRDWSAITQAARLAAREAA